MSVLLTAGEGAGWGSRTVACVGWGDAGWGSCCDVDGVGVDGGILCIGDGEEEVEDGAVVNR